MKSATTLDSPPQVPVQPSGFHDPTIRTTIPTLHESAEIEESSVSIPLHPLGVKPSGNQYTATSNARHAIGVFQLLPDEVVAILLESFDAELLSLLGSTCKFLYAFCRSEEFWKPLFIE